MLVRLKLQIEGTISTTNLHACVHNSKEVGMVGESVSCSHQHHTCPIQVGLCEGHLTVRGEVLNHPAYGNSFGQEFHTTVTVLIYP